MKHRVLRRSMAVMAMLMLSYFGMAQEQPQNEGETSCTAPTAATSGVAIGGAVYGGGRKANVNGNSFVAVINAKTISAVYGGNDIAGSVNGTSGSKIWIGKTATESAFADGTTWTATGTTSANLKIGSVYGGGNGYYIYPTSVGDVVAAGETSFTLTDGFELKYHKYTGSGDSPVTEETLTTGTYNIPTIVKTDITVAASDKVFIDSLFGGAKNAFVDPTPSATATDICANITINGGTIYSVFGGNNYGGTIGSSYLTSGTTGYTTNTNTTNITVASTTLVSGNTEACLGITHGIKYLFGGGNKVLSPNVTVAVNGGQIDTAFAGGNNATVAKTTFVLNAADGNRIYGTGFTDGSTITTTHSGDITGSVAANTAYPFNAKGGRIVSGSYQISSADATNIYNIRTLFGGNNAADMYCLPVVTLTSGGIGTVYGGGNAGDMKYAESGTTRSTAYPSLPADLATDEIVGTLVNLNSSNIYVDYVYGGCQKASVDYDTYVLMQNGHVGNIYGGCNISGDVGSYRSKLTSYPKYDLNGNLVSGATVNVTENASSRVYVKGGYVFGNVFAGSNGYYHCNDITLYESGHDFAAPETYVGQRIPTMNNAFVQVNGGQVYGNVYGGGNLANVGYYSGTDGQYNFLDEAHTCTRYSGSGNVTDYNNGYAHVVVTGSPYIGGNIFAGGNMASVFGIGDMSISGSPVINGDVYGGNDKLGHVQSGASTWWDGTHTASDGTSLTSLNASAYVKVTGTPKIHAVYGGGNGDYTYNSTDMCYTSEADKPIQSSSFVDINIDAAGHITNVFGGGNGVTVKDSVTVLINATVVGSAATDAMVDTVFGGCNKATMNTVPNIQLKKGWVGDVYGGGNAGDMTGQRLRDEVAGVSTYIKLDNSNIKVSGTIYGGCNQADVTGGTLVHIANGDANIVYGGNNISGNIGGQTHVLVDGGTVSQVYGGSNGYYTYHSDGTKTYAYPWGTTNFATTSPVGTGTIPNCGNTDVLLKGGTINGYIYGGGYAGSCDNTSVEVTGTATLTGEAIYGGGLGDIDHLGYCETTTYPHLGNVTGLSKVVLNSMDESSNIKKVYGGGHAGDAKKTNVVLNNTCEHHFTCVYGGCYAANVGDTATLTLNGKIMKIGTTPVVNVDTIYGGNDVAGNVGVSVLTVNSGRYVAAFGAGNGDYNYKKLYSSLHPSVNFNNVSCWDSIPSNHEVLFTINDKSATRLDSTYFEGWVYGGGNMGMVGDRAINSTTAVTDAQYGLIRLNIHGGYFAKRVYAGARGKASYLGSIVPFFNMDTSKGQTLQLVYGLKEVNMDGGKIMLSLHGGSEFINDGYPYECKGKDYNNADATVANTTMRPSSIINILGGTITKSLYGGGFEGTIYGSVYVNVGKSAVEKSEVWTKHYGSSTAGYMDHSVSFAAYKPNTDGTGTDVTALKRDGIYLLANVYAGSDWGDAGKNAVFSTRGVYGGETNVYIDGEGYSTTEASGGTDATQLSLAASIFGAGTSTEGGDVNRKVMLFNYSKNQCLTTDRSLQSIQRADTVLLDHAYITLTGAQDAYFAYPSQNYSLCRVRNFIMRDDNYVVISAPAIYIDTMESLKRTNSVTPATYALCDITDNEVTEEHSNCDPASTAGCPILNDAGNRNVLMISGGTYLSVLGYRDDNLTDNIYTNNNTTYGPMLGYCYLGTADNTQVYVYARSKEAANNGTTLNNGFWSICNTDNANSTIVNEGHTELPYINASNNEHYRTWRIGDVSAGRTRSTTIVANQNPTSYASNNHWLGTNGDWTAANGTTYKGYAYASATLELPPANGGSYYTLSNISVDAENSGEMHLIQAAWDPTGSTWITDGSGNAVDGAAINANPSYTFGLKFKTSGDFETCSNDTTCHEQAVISGSNTVTYINGYTSPTVKTGSVSVINRLDLDLTYSTKFTRTIVRRVTFTMTEHIHNADGSTTLSPVYVTVDIATVVNDFSNMETKALAMYNEGISHKYLRKVVLPATYEQRHLYLTNVEWKCDVTDKFQLSDTANNNAAAYNDANGETHSTAKDDKATFSVTMQPSESIGDNMSNSVGWYAVEGEEAATKTVFDIRDLYDVKTGNTGNTTPIATRASTSLTTITQPVAAVSNNDSVAWIQSGKSVGILDGRATAAVDLTLFYNGSKVYDKEDDLGTVTMTFGYVGPQSARGYSTGTFKITLKVWSRNSGDTIYLASTLPSKYFVKDAHDSIIHNPAYVGVIREGITLKGYDAAHAGTAEGSTARSEVESLKGKLPDYYLTSFAEALNPGDPYIEGDVIDIIDEVQLKGTDNYVLHGRDNDGEEYGMIQIIRYSGSHYQMPGENGAYRGPMVTLSDNAQLSLYNIWMNGSGMTRMKEFTTSTSTTLGNRTALTEGGATHYYYEKAERVKDTLFASAPMVLVKDNGVFSTMSNIKMNNAINGANLHSNANALPGGAIAVMQTNTSYTPKVVLGDNIRIYNNATVNHSVPNSLAATPAREPGNYGAAVYVNNGNLQIGTNKTGCKVVAKQNFYLWKAPIIGSTTYYDDGANGLTVSMTSISPAYRWSKIHKQWLSDTTSTANPLPAVGSYGFPDIAIDTLKTEKGKYAYYYLFKDFPNSNKDTVWNNIYLPRTSIAANTGDAKERYDNQSNHLTFLTQLSKDSKVGVSKWFPGGAPSYYKDLRDTIGFGVCNTSPAIISAVYENGNFFADSMRYNIDIFFHKYVHPSHIYFHRCATFDYNTGNDISYHMDKSALCPGGTDSLMFRLQQGFMPYTYTWYGDTAVMEAGVLKPKEGTAIMMREKTTVATVLDVNNTTLAAQARVDTLNLYNVKLPAGTNEAYYYYTVTGKDLGNCVKKKSAYVKVVKTNATSYTDDANFLEKGATYVVGSRSGNATDNIVSSLDSSDYHYHTTTTGGTPITVSNCATNKYLRTYKAYQLIASVKPSASYGNVYTEKDISGTSTGNPVPTEYSVTPPTLMCPGDVVNLYTESVKTTGNTPTVPAYNFLFWNFDANAGQHTQFTMPEANAEVSAYYGPKDYWYQVVTSLPTGYSVSYHGNVTIGDANALAWLISTVNGLNFQQAQTFVFDTIILTAAEYDMSEHKWTPLGSINHAFRGTFVSALSTGSVIKGVFCDEDNIPYVGFFGNLDSARIGNVDATLDSTITLKDSYFAGHNYAGAISAWATNKTVVNNVKIENVTLAADNAVGGAFGRAENTTIKNCQIGKTTTGESVYYLGPTVYLGGIFGQSNKVTANNNAAQKVVAANAHALYSGGITAKNESGQSFSPRGVWGRLLGRHKAAAKTAGSSIFVNNYVNLHTADNAFRVGGLVGDASNATLKNNYAYGDIAATNLASSLVAVVGDGVQMDHCYYNYDMGHSTGAIGSNDYANNVSDTSAFVGAGSQVKTTSRVEGINYVTVLMNKYVRENGGDSLQSWRSDMVGENNGLPVFGIPDTIPIYSTQYDEACDSYSWEGNTYNNSGHYSTHYFNDTLLTDSIITLYLTINKSTTMALSDTVTMGHGYNRYGFNLTGTELSNLLGGDTLSDVQILQIADSLLTSHGCDSVVVMNLVVFKKRNTGNVGITDPTNDHGTVIPFEVKVYPNPTLGVITVESDDLQNIEVYDNVSRRVLQTNATGNKKQVDLSRFSSGAYYVRVTTAQGVAVKKVIKK